MSLSYDTSGHAVLALDSLFTHDVGWSWDDPVLILPQDPLTREHPSQLLFSFCWEQWGVRKCDHSQMISLS